MNGVTVEILGPKAVLVILVAVKSKSSLFESFAIGTFDEVLLFSIMALTKFSFIDSTTFFNILSLDYFIILI